jgi:NADH-quinone oxidoreductase subunit J
VPSETILFAILALMTLVSAGMMISMHRPIDAALSFIVTLVSLAGLFALAGSGFLFAVQIIIYAGAILSLILFIIMFLNIKEENLPEEPYKWRWMAAAAALVAPFCFVLARLVQATDFGAPAAAVEGFGTIRTIGLDLFSEWVLPFELISILLLVALVGAVTLASKEEA